MAPFWLGVALLLGVPLVLAAGYAFTDHTGLGDPVFNGLDNLRRAREDPLLAASLRASFAYVLLAVPLRLLTGIGLGLLLARRAPFFRGARAAVYTPSVMPDVALTLVAAWAVNPMSGPVNQLLGALGLPEPVWLASAWGARTVVAFMMALALGETFLVVLVARRTVPADEYAAAALDGAGPWRQLRHVTWPRLAPLFALLAVREVAVALHVNFVPVYLLTDGGPDSATLFLPLYIFDQAFEFLGFGYAAFLSLALLVVSAGLVGAAVLVGLGIPALRRRRAGRAHPPGYQERGPRGLRERGRT
ncbi:hypothetical protein Q760_04180 [Cellulomonas cellasea DSM 20118]|uniref:ABC transmembrane type-1 domain-containing protein n=3 Tax=Cellulomonas cellasea TaxID=43670 RepID=A0A0A0B5H8_9CELL|nr:hypothetical protein Q760_04180 [Cellulomonas cellasea DSM 20118]GEA87533.1 hypothetical protein CCE01nite_14820 [Cellulomonas cellasea]